MAMMRAIAIVDGADGPTLEPVSTARPEPEGAQVLIEVMAAGVNRADLRRSQAHFDVTGPLIAGLEVSGRVVAIGPDVAEFQPGDRVAAMAPGGYAEFVVADATSTLAIPQGVPFIAAAALAVWYQTAHDALVTAGGFRSGDTVLITAAKSGVGLAAAQCAKALGAGCVIGTARAPDPRLSKAGFDHVVAGDASELVGAVRDLTDKAGANVTIDMVGAGLVPALIETAALGGRIVSVGRMGGFHDTVNFDMLALKRLSLIGVTFRTRTSEQKRAVRDAMLKDLSEHLAKGRVRPVIDRVFPLEAAVQAQEHMRANHHYGKVVLSVGARD